MASTRTTGEKARRRLRSTPVRVHIQNDPHTNEVFAITPERFEAAAKRVPALARRIGVTYGDDPASVDAGLRDAEVLIAGHFEAESLAAGAPRLRWIQSTNAGVEDVLPLLPPGVTLTNASGVHGPKGAEFALAALLMLNHGVPYFVTQQRERRWEQRFTTTIAGKTVAIVGVGRIGAEVARLARRFGLRVLGVRRNARPHRLVDEMYGPRALHKVLPRADFVVVTTPLTPETRSLIGRRELDLLPTQAGLVNLGRGAVIDNEALAEKLARGELRGAVLDVFDEEPLPPDSPLWTTPNLVITPHCAVDDGPQYVPRCLEIFFDNLRRYLAGRPLRNRIDPARGY
ncbi:MAG: D-2-hydroxyacid dehydrogenase [Candidatus Rokubacteria bacterium]|nr:D-2-hydroxyacid dehydrogenase [Candidatus Rokubacteria bacterium]